MHPLSGILTPFTPWKILSWFLEHPSERVHVNRMARELGISTSSASTRLADLQKAGILVRERSANAVFYSLENGSSVVRQLKRLHTIMKMETLNLSDAFLSCDDAVLSAALYGSYASGENDVHSDLDLLVISAGKKQSYAPVRETLENAFGCEVNIQTYAPAGWEKLKRSDKHFHLSLLSKHIILFGSELP